MTARPNRSTPTTPRKERTGARRYTAAQALRRAEFAYDISGVDPVLRQRLDYSAGAERDLPVRTAVVATFASLLRQSDGFISEQREFIRELNRSTKQRLGVLRQGKRAARHAEVTYDQFHDLFTSITSALADGWCELHPHDGYAQWTLQYREQARVVHRCPHKCPATLWRDMFWFINAMAEATCPNDIEMGSSFAVDSTDFEAHARRRSYDSGRPATDVDDIDLFADESSRYPGRGKRVQNELGFPRTLADGRSQHSVDPDAAEGWRSGKNKRRSSTFLGWDIHLANHTTPRDSTFRQPLCVRGINIVPAGSHKGLAAFEIFEDMVVRRGLDVRDVLADMGYTTSYAENFHHLLRGMGIDIVGDLHPNQRGRFPFRKGLVVIDGTVFPESVPHDRTNLPTFSPFMDSDAKRVLIAQYDTRAADAFRRIAILGDGRERLAGPAYGERRTARCVNVPASKTASTTLPWTNCKPGDHCLCGKTITIGADDIPRIRQRDAWGSSAWHRDYSRRPMIEAQNAMIKYHFLKIERHFTHVMGTAKNAFFIGLAVAATNVRNADEFRKAFTIVDPMGDLDEAPTSPARKRRSDYLMGVSDLGSTDPPT